MFQLGCFQPTAKERHVPLQPDVFKSLSGRLDCASKSVFDRRFEQTENCTSFEIAGPPSKMPMPVQTLCPIHLHSIPHLLASNRNWAECFLIKWKEKSQTASAGSERMLQYKEARVTTTPQMASVHWSRMQPSGMGLKVCKPQVVLSLDLSSGLTSGSRQMDRAPIVPGAIIGGKSRKRPPFRVHCSAVLHWTCGLSHCASLSILP